MAILRRTGTSKLTAPDFDRFAAGSRAQRFLGVFGLRLLSFDLDRSCLQETRGSRGTEHARQIGPGKPLGHGIRAKRFKSGAVSFDVCRRSMAMQRFQ